MKNRMLVLENIEYSRYEQKILQGIDLVIDEGDFVILIGPNGSGKSTLLKMLSGSLNPSSGKIFIDGHNVAKRPMHEVARMVATLTQDLRISTFSELTVEMNIDLAFSRSPGIGLRRGVKADYLASFNQSLKDKLDVLAGHLSGGQRQSLALAMCFAHTPKVLLLDEHTSALDPKAAASLMALTNAHVGEKKLTTIMITHSLDQALQFGNRLLAINEGRIVADMRASEKSALTKNDLISLAY